MSAATGLGGEAFEFGGLLADEALKGLVEFGDGSAEGFVAALLGFLEFTEHFLERLCGLFLLALGGTGLVFLNLLGGVFLELRDEFFAAFFGGLLHGLREAGVGLLHLLGLLFERFDDRAGSLREFLLLLGDAVELVALLGGELVRSFALGLLARGAGLVGDLLLLGDEAFEGAASGPAVAAAFEHLHDLVELLLGVALGGFELLLLLGGGLILFAAGEGFEFLAREVGGFGGFARGGFHVVEELRDRGVFGVVPGDA